MNVLSQYPETEGVDLYRSQTWVFPGSRAAAEGLSYGAHDTLVSKISDLLVANQVSVTIKYWTPDTA